MSRRFKNRKNPYPSIKKITIKGDGASYQKVLEQEGLINPSLHINYDCFRKTEQDKKYLKKLKSQHKKELIKAGHNPKKTLNLLETFK
jgi:hypothetical protein